MRKSFLFIVLILAVLFIRCIVSADEQPQVTLSVNGQSESPVSITSFADTVIVVQAPGATGVRIFNTNNWDENNPENRPVEECWEYYDRNNTFLWLEIHQRFGNWVTKPIIAQARYDDYDKVDEWDENNDPWTGESNPITLNVTANNGPMQNPTASLDESSYDPGEFLTVTTRSMGYNEFYWADLFQIVNGDDLEHRDHFDFRNPGENYIPLIYPAGDYVLRVSTSAPGFKYDGYTDLQFTLTDTQIQQPCFSIYKTDPVVGEAIPFFVLYDDAEKIIVEITKEGDPTWFVRDEWNKNDEWPIFLVRDLRTFYESGTYTMTAKDVDETVIGEPQTVTVSEAGRLAKPNLFALPVLLTVGDSLSGVIGVDEHADSMDIEIYKVTFTDEDWQFVIRTHRNRENQNWNQLNIPADMLSRPGVYRIEVNTGAQQNYDGSGQNLFFVVQDQNAQNTLQLTVKGSTDNISSWPSSKNLMIDAQAEGATAIRLLRDGWWDYQIADHNGHFRWEQGFGDGDYTIIAQMTTIDPGWGEENFDWESFRWEDLEWTDYSNAVKLHVISSEGELETPEITLDPADGNVNEGGILKVTIEPQDDAQWSWAELQKLEIDPNDPRNRRLKTVENGHFDCDSDYTNMIIPTFPFEAGDYWLTVGVDAEGWHGNETCVPVTITQAAEPPEPDMIFSRNEMLSGENIKIYAWAADSTGMDLVITRDGDLDWQDERHTDNKFEIWDWGCGKAGEYTFDLTIHYSESEKDDVHLPSQTLTVSSPDGKLDAPVLEDIPNVHNQNIAINGSFDPVEGASWYDVELYYIRNGYEWEQVYRERRDPQDEGATTLAFEDYYFDEPGIFQLNVNAGRIGFDSGYTECRILVVAPDSFIDQNLVLDVNGQKGSENISEIYLYQNISVSLVKPSYATAARVWNGFDWDIWAASDDDWTREWSADYQGNITYIAQATADPKVTAWEQENGNFDEFDWSAVNWSLTSNSVSFHVICLGDLDAPAVTFPNGTTVERGDDLVLSFEAVENASVYGVMIQQMDGEWIYGAEYSDPGEYSFLTDTLPAGSYRVIVEPRHYGWRGHGSGQVITVTETTSWDDNRPYFKIVKTEVLTNEDFAVAVHMPGAMKVSICHNTEDNPWWDDYTDTHVLTFRVPDSDEWVFRAYAQFEEDGAWVQIGSAITVTAEAPDGDLPGPRIWMQNVWTAGQDLDFVVDQPTGKYVHVEIYERDNPENCVYRDEFDNDWDWRYIFDADWFVPGTFYNLEVTSKRTGYNSNWTVFPICMLPAEMDTLILPENLTTIEDDSFRGIGAQKIVIPESVTTIGANAFAECPNLLVVEVPTNPEGIHVYAFSPDSGPFMFYVTEETEEIGYRIPEATLIYLGEFE